MIVESPNVRQWMNNRKKEQMSQKAIWVCHYSKHSDMDLEGICCFKSKTDFSPSLLLYLD